MLRTKLAIDAVKGIDAVISALSSNKASDRLGKSQNLLGDEYITGSQANEILDLAIIHDYANQDIFEAYLHAHARCADAGSVMRGLKLMRDRRIARSAHAFSALLLAYSNAHDCAGLLRTYAELTQDSNVGLSDEIFHVVLVHLARVEMGQIPLSNNTKIDASKPNNNNNNNNNNYNISKSNGEHVTHLKTVKDVMDDMLVKGMVPSMRTYNALIAICTQQRNYHRLMEYYSDMKRHGVPCNLYTYNMTLEGLRLCGKMDEFLEVMKEMNANTTIIPNTHTYNTLFFALKSQEQDSPLYNLISSMIDFDNFRPNMVTYNALIFQYVREGNHEKVKNIISHMTQSGMAPDQVTYHSLMDMCVSQGPQAIITMFTEMKSHFPPTARSYTILIRGLCNCGAADTAMKYLEEMKQNRIQPTEVCYIVLMDAFGERGDIEACLRLSNAAEQANGGALSVIIRDKLLGYLEKHNPTEYLLVLLDMAKKYKNFNFDKKNNNLHVNIQ